MNNEKYYRYNYEFSEFKDSVMYKDAPEEYKTAIDHLMEVYGAKDKLANNPDDSNNADDRRRAMYYINRHLDEITVLDEYELVTISNLMMVSSNRIRFVSDVISMLNRFKSYNNSEEEE